MSIELLIQYRRSPSIALRNQIAVANLGLVYRVVNRFAKNSAIPVEDLESVGVIGLIKAIESFEPARGFAFSSYAIPRIRGELMHYRRDKGTPGGFKIPRAWTDNKGRLERGEDCRVPLPERAMAIEALQHRQPASLDYRKGGEDGDRWDIADERPSGTLKLTTIDLCNMLGFPPNHGYFNATAACRQHDPQKTPRDFLRLSGTRERLQLAQKRGITPILRKRGRNGSTWLHHDLSADFMLWLSPESRDKLLSVLSAELQELAH